MDVEAAGDRPTRGLRRAQAGELGRRAAAVDLGVWLRPFRDLVYVMPPYVTGERDLAQIAVAAVAAALAGAPR